MLKYLKKYWFFALLAPVYMIGEVSMDLLQPELMSRIIDDGVLGLNNGGVGNLNTVITIGLKMIGFVALGGICGIMSGVFANLCAQQFGNDVRKAVFKRIMEFSFEQTDKFSTGSLITRVTNDITQLQNFVMQCPKKEDEYLNRNSIEFHSHQGYRLVGEFYDCGYKFKSILSAVYQKIILKLGKPRTITLSDKAKVVFFIGPTGVGKTTTIAKIASSFKLEHEAKVAFITADTYRIAAVEQLNTCASIIDCPVSVVYSVEDMDKSLTDYKDYDLILIDTAGRSHKADDQMDELKSFIEQVVQRKDEFDFESYLTLSVTTKYKDLKSIADKYDDVDWSIIFTKLDETCSLGNILNMRMLTDRPLAYTTSGQNVPNDIEVINEQWIAKQLLGGGE